MNDVKTYISEAEDKMNLTVAFLDEALATIRAGKANPRILDQVRVEYYGSMVTISDSDFANTKLVYGGAEGANPDVTIDNTKNVDMNITSQSAVTLGTDLKIEGESTIGDVLLAGGVQLTVPADQTFTAKSIGIYEDENGASTGYIVTENPDNITTVKPIEVPIVDPESGSVIVTTEEILEDALANGAITDIAIDGEIKITSVVTVNRAVNIVGINGATLVAVPNDGPYNGKYSPGTDKYVLNITAGANIKNLTVDSDYAAFGINIWSGEATITDVVSNNSAGAAFTIGGGATVTMDGTSASGYVWGGVNADKSATVTFVDAEAFENVGSVYGEDSTKVTINLPADYKAAVEMTGKWGSGKTKTDFKGYYTTLDNVLPYYNDSQSRFDYDGSKIEVNKDTTNNKDFTLKSGTTLAIAKNVTLTNADEVTFTIEYGATVEGTISSGKYILTPDNNGNYTYPEFEDGTVITKDGAEEAIEALRKREGRA